MNLLLGAEQAPTLAHKTGKRSAPTNSVQILEGWRVHAFRRNARWTDQGNPKHTLEFTEVIRGRQLPAALEYWQCSNLLGLFIYIPNISMPHREVELLRAVNDLNCRVLVGNFELIPADRSVMFRITTNFADAVLSTAFLDTIVDEAFKTVEGSLPELMRAAWAKTFVSA